MPGLRVGPMRALAAVGVAFALSTAGCTSVVNGAGTVAAGGSVSPLGSSGSSSPASPSGSSALGQKAIVELTPTAAGPASAGDFSSAVFTTPSGFVRILGYYQVVPLEENFLSWYARPSAGGDVRAVIAVLVYALPSRGLVDSAAQQRARIDYYNTRLKATVRVPLAAATVAGLDGFRETVDQPGGFHYSTWFAFGAQHVVQVSCQSGDASQAPTLAAGCNSVLASLQVH